VPTPDGDQVVVVAGRSLAAFASHPHWTAAAMTVAVAMVILVGGRLRPAVPFSLVAVVLATVLAEVAGLHVVRIGALPSGLAAPSLGFLDFSVLWSLVGPALAVAALAALESLLSAAVADGMGVNHKHDPDRELFGQGLANLVVPMFGGVPATGAIARTAVNVRSGAGSRLAALVHAAVLAVIVYTAAPLVGRIPVAALAGVLLATAIRMVEVGSVRAMARATRSDALVLALTAAATLALDLVKAVILGLVVAGALALRAVARSATLRQMPLHPDLAGDHTVEERALLDEHIVAYRIDGPLLFAAHRFLLELSEVAHVSVVILRMSAVSAVDATGALVLKDAIEKLEHRGMVVLISGIQPDHHQPLDALDAIAHLRSAGRVFPSTPDAIAAARRHLHREGIVVSGQYSP
jgi:SulP family sulfate permease